MNKYELINYNDYPLVKIGNYVFLIDSGCPWSISFTRLANVIINGIDCTAKFRYMPHHMTGNDMNNAFGCIVAGFIGYDILRSFSVLEVDLANNTVMFGNSDKEKANVCPLVNLKTNVLLNGRPAIAFLDTGAHIVMVQNKSLLNNANYIGTCVEESNAGAFTLNKYKSLLQISTISKEVDVLEHNGRMPSMPGIDLYFGLNQFASEYYVLDFKENIFYFK